jgi:hypothetical protein
MIHKIKIDKLDLIKIKINKNFCSVKYPLKRMQKQLQSGRKQL